LSEIITNTLEESVRLSNEFAKTKKVFEELKEKIEYYSY
jgi:hypothetical protein